MADETVPPIVHALSGAVASIFSNTAVYPLDFVTTRLQTQEKNVSAAGKEHDKETEKQDVSGEFGRIYRDHGLTEFYRGLGADNLSTMASTFCYHFAYNFIRERRVEVHTKRRGGHRPSVLSMMEELTIGATAGVFSRFVTSPASNVVTRSQTQDTGTTWEIVQDIYREKGITGFFSGMKASVILAANPSIAYYLFEVLKAMFVPKSRRASPKAVEIFLLSATGKAIATLLLYPVILIKARTQAQRAKTGIFSMMKRIFNNEGGLAGFYKGAKLQVLKGFLSQGILMLLKDKIAAAIVAAYLGISRGRKTALPSSRTLHFADPPKQDVNGLILATKDYVEEAVDQAMDKAKEVAQDVAQATHIDRLSSIAEAGREKLGHGIEQAGKLIAGNISPANASKPTEAAAGAVKEGIEWTGQQRPRNIEGIEWSKQTRKP
jgi:hypothetical protein